MFEDYYDSCEPTAIESAYQEFVEKAKMLLKDEVKQKIGESKKVLEEANKIRNEYYDKKREYEKLIENQEGEIKKQVEKLKNEWIESLNLDLDVGQTVWTVGEFDTDSIICPHCKGKHSTVKIINGKENTSLCKFCSYDGRIYKKTYNIRQCKICCIEVRLLKRNNNVWEEDDSKNIENKITCIYVKGNCYQHSRKDIFIKEEDAEKECKEMNDKEEELFNSKIKGEPKNEE